MLRVKEQDRHLLMLMQVAIKNGLVFNNNKCRIRQTEISFHGGVFTSIDMKPNPSKVQALQDLPLPDNQTKLQSFLGSINYSQPFIARLANMNNCLHEQLVEWDSNPSTDAAFQHLKSSIYSILLKITHVYYERNQPVIIWTDAREYGLGKGPITNGCPMTFSSETHYAIIE